MSVNPWFRMYSEFATDPKVQSMSEIMQRRLVMLFCLRCSDVLVTLCDDDLAFALRVTEQELADTKSLFVRKGFIDDKWNLVNWGKRQFVSDSSTKRTREYRERRRTSHSSHGDGGERKCDATDTDTDTDTENKNIAPKTAARKVSVLTGPGRFEEFYSLYPRKKDKPAAMRAWRSKAKTDGMAGEIIGGLKDRLPALLAKEIEFVAYPQKWLKEERWKDPIEPPDSRPQRNGWRTSTDIPNYPAAVLPGPDVGVSIAPMKIIRKGHAK